ncbi:MAG: radical SAM protein [Nanoarchaeota archaeon]|nr:radical SAM protein [Nanoarchaeota archaeon]
MKTYGPVPSWRLGNSLGVDLVEAPEGYDKVCSFDCVYCQLGHRVFRMSSPKKMEISEAEFEELRKKIAQTSPDYITFSGEGEPTLNLNLGYAAKRIRAITNVPLAVLTNASFVHLPRVRDGLNACDLVIAKIDAPNQELFERINQPYHGLTIKSIVQNLKKIRTKIAIQTLLFSYDGLTNADETAINGLIDIYKELNCSKPITIYLGTAYRPTDFKGLEAISERQLKSIADNISSQLGIEVIYYQGAEPRMIARKLTDKELRKEILELLKRRPCTLKDISSRFGNVDVSGVLESLIKEGILGNRIQNAEKFYFLIKPIILKKLNKKLR